MGLDEEFRRAGVNRGLGERDVDVRAIAERFGKTATGDNHGVALRLEQAALVDLGTYWGDTLERCGAWNAHWNPDLRQLPHPLIFEHKASVHPAQPVTNRGRQACNMA
jgi:hypothetical protein